MENSDFKLKNSHRVAALKLAIERINDQKVKPLYHRREQLNLRVAQLAMETLLDSAKPFSGMEHLIDAGICVRESALKLGQYVEPVLGVAVINPSLGENWHVLTDHSGRSLIKLVHGQADALSMPQAVATFRPSGPAPTGHMVPVATLDWVLRHLHARELPNPIAPLISEILDDVVPAILGSFEQVTEIVKLIGSCTNHSDLVRAFPAAASLFQPKQHETPPASAAALNLLHALS